MGDDDLKKLVAQGLTAMRAGSKTAQDATQEIQGSATSPDLKQALEQGTKTAATWSERIDRALQMAGGPVGEQSNPILEAHHEVSRRIRAEATSDGSRDLGIVASGQLALHYWIAAFGTIRNYAEKLGMTEVDADFRACVEEAKRADDEHTALAETMLRQEEMA